MSRIGRNPINILNDTTVTFNEQDRMVTVKGSKGELHQTIDVGFKIRQEGTQLFVERPSEQKRHKAMHGLYRALIANMVEGVGTGYRRQLELIGVGFKANLEGHVLELNIGHSHSIFLVIPPEIKAQTITKKGTNPTIILEGIDKQLVGHIGAKIKSLCKKDPYKGKGIYYTGETIRRKAGKTAAK